MYVINWCFDMQLVRRIRVMLSRNPINYNGVERQNFAGIYIIFLCRFMISVIFLKSSTSDEAQIKQSVNAVSFNSILKPIQEKERKIR